MSILGLLFGFRGRIDRRQFMVAMLAQGLVFGGILALYFLAVRSTFTLGLVESVVFGSTSIESLIPTLAPLGLILVLMLWSNAAVVTKRFHDLNRGMGWLILVYGPISLVVACALGYLFPTIIPMKMKLMLPLAVIAMGWTSFYISTTLGFKSGTEGPNRFDHDPLGKAFATKGSGIDWDNPSNSGGKRSLGGMEAAMAAMTAAARENPTPQSVRGSTPAPPSRQPTAPQFGQNAPPQFGRMAPSQTGGFGRRGL